MSGTPINSPDTHIGIELGSTRIKAVLIGPDSRVLASGSHGWENRLENGVWTYGFGDIRTGLQSCFAELLRDAREKYGQELTSAGSMGISAMMHGYLVLDRYDRPLVPFRTWRNTFTGRESAELTELFGYPVPQRWSAAHLYHALLGNESHVADIAFMTTLAGYVHYLLTGRKVLGVGDASGMFPVDSHGAFDPELLKIFGGLPAFGKLSLRPEDILPQTLSAGCFAGELTAQGAALLDPTGGFAPGVPMCPPEGDAGAGMAATNSVLPGTGNISAGTSVFLMTVLDKKLRRTHPEIDLVTTPAGDPTAMVHCNNCTCDIDAWAAVFGEFSAAMGIRADKSAVYDALYAAAASAGPDCGGLLSYNYLSGESVTGADSGRPIFLRSPGSSFTLGNFMRMNIYSALATLRLGLDVLTGGEGVSLRKIYAHGGLYKAKGVTQQITADALKAPVCSTPTGGEGGPWGMALLAAYMTGRDENETLGAYLERRVFSAVDSVTLLPTADGAAGFDKFLERYRAGLNVEKAAAGLTL